MTRVVRSDRAGLVRGARPKAMRASSGMPRPPAMRWRRVINEQFVEAADIFARQIEAA
jgi:hypothetical protein